MFNPSETDTLLSSLHAGLHASEAECERLDAENEKLSSSNEALRAQNEQLHMQLESLREENARLSADAETSSTSDAENSGGGVRSTTQILTYRRDDGFVFSWPARAIREGFVMWTKEGWGLHVNGQRVSGIGESHENLLLFHEAFLEVLRQVDL